MKVCIILGTRPEIIKMSPIIKECQKRSLDYFIIHTGQHYSYNLDKIFFEELELPEPRYNLEIGSHIHGKQMNLMTKKIEEKLKLEKPDIVLVEGDTNSVLAGALVANKLGIKIGHVEAGLRSYQVMLEEFNRTITGIYADYHFSPTKNSKENLIKEGIDENKIFVTGNTVVDALNENIKISNKKYEILKKLNLKKDEYFILTLHRAESVDDKTKLSNIFKSLEGLSQKYKIVFPVHPRTKNKLIEFELKVPEGVIEIEPLGYLEFLQLMANSRLIITDSGGIQEESCILKIPCVTVREGTERPETLEVGSNLLAGYEQDKIIRSVELMLKKEKNWENPFGNGKTAEKIINVILS